MMKSTFLKFLKLKKDALPPLKSLRPPIFDTDLYWFVSLGACLLIFVLTAFVGFWLFYSQYFERYKKDWSAENFENMINIEKLNRVIEKRNEFINKETSLPEDPSL